VKGELDAQIPAFQAYLTETMPDFPELQKFSLSWGNIYSMFV
jgi:hypothetical protein